VLDSSVFSTLATAAHAAEMEVPDDGTAIAIETEGRNFMPGTYRSGSKINFVYGIVVTLDGNTKDSPLFLFQAIRPLVTTADTYFILKKGAKAENVYWAFGTATALGANRVIEGSILAGTAIIFGTKLALHDCALAQSAVTFESEGFIKANQYIDFTLTLCG
jgi:hypothetical protein